MHGALPLPAPATLALLEGVPIRYVDEVEKELVTPTGAVLLTSIAHEFGGFPAMTLGRVGLGAGRRELPFPNVVRVWLGETAQRRDADGLIVETLTLLETNIDDLNPQVYEHVLNRLLAAGALDVTLTPMHMKKNRPATQLAVLCRPNEADTLAADHLDGDDHARRAALGDRAGESAAIDRDGGDALWIDPREGGALE